MSCQYKKECPSCSGWCESPKQDFSKCIPFLITAYENKEVNKELSEESNNSNNSNSSNNSYNNDSNGNNNNTLTGFSRLSGEYNRGYTKAIQDIIEIFNYAQLDISHAHKRMTPKKMEELLKCCLDNRAKIRDQYKGFIRFNRITQSFEFYELDIIKEGNKNGK